MKDINNLQNVELDPAKLKGLRGSVDKAAVGSQIGVGSTQIANYENGYRKPSADKLLRLMLLYNVKPEDITLEVAS
jgi:transcriptional regulator with XRE-family HTH domain